MQKCAELPESFQSKLADQQNQIEALMCRPTKSECRTSGGQNCTASLERRVNQQSRLELGCVSTVDSHGRTILIADVHRGDGKLFVVRQISREERFQNEP